TGPCSTGAPRRGCGRPAHGGRSTGRTARTRHTPPLTIIVALLAVPRSADRCPDPLRRRGHVNVTDAEIADRVDDGALHGGGGADRAGLTDALESERVGGGRCLAGQQ